MSKFMTRFLKDETGATAIEYGLIISIISIAVVGGATVIATKINGTFNNISGAFK